MSHVDFAGHPESEPLVVGNVAILGGLEVRRQTLSVAAIEDWLEECATNSLPLC